MWARLLSSACRSCKGRGCIPELACTQIPTRLSVISSSWRSTLAHEPGKQRRCGAEESKNSAALCAPQVGVFPHIVRMELTFSLQAGLPAVNWKRQRSKASSSGAVSGNLWWPAPRVVRWLHATVVPGLAGQGCRGQPGLGPAGSGRRF